MNPDGEGANRTVSAQQVQEGIKCCGVDLSAEESACVAGDFNKLFEEICGGAPSKVRMNAICELFDKFDPSGTGVVSAENLKGQYQCKAHPQVISGELTEDEVFLEFLSHFSDKYNDGCITRDEWCDHYCAVSTCI